ncbi:hypothetical protein GP486_007973, partial [Trichoglossum hirsutum]
LLRTSSATFSRPSYTPISFIQLESESLLGFSTTAEEMRLNQQPEHAAEGNACPLIEASPSSRPGDQGSRAQISTQLFEPAASFFSSVSPEGYPKPTEKLQPWRAVWKGPNAPLPDGKLLVACPKRCLYGMQTINWGLKTPI